MYGAGCTDIFVDCGFPLSLERIGVECFRKRNRKQILCGQITRLALKKSVENKVFCHIFTCLKCPNGMISLNNDRSYYLLTIHVTMSYIVNLWFAESF